MTAASPPPHNGVPQPAHIAPGRVNNERCIVLRKTRIRGWVAAGVLLVSACLFPLLNRFTAHPDETVTLLMPPALATMLWLGWPRVRHIPARRYLIYLVVMTATIAAAEAFAAHMARGRLLWIEVGWALYFVVAWRLAWALYSRTVGRLGEARRRWGRRVRKRGSGAPAAQLRQARAARLIGPLRTALVVLVFAPLVLGALIHRIKIGNALDLGDNSDLQLETVTFTTRDGLALSGWFLPDPGSDATVVICHGAGANKGNFIDFLRVFDGRGYNSLIFDARAHGESAGHTTTFGLFETADVTAAVDWLKQTRPEQARHLYGLGSSMGAMTLLRAAADDPRIEAVVLDSCFASAPLLARQHTERLPVLGPLYADLIMASMSLHAGRSFWSLDGRNAIARLAPRPVLLIHGEDDFVIPPVNLDIMYAAAREPKQRWLGPGLHSNILTTDFEQYQRRVLEFLQAARSPEP